MYTLLQISIRSELGTIHIAWACVFRSVVFIMCTLCIEKMQHRERAWTAGGCRGSSCRSNSKAWPPIGRAPPTVRHRHRAILKYFWVLRQLSPTDNRNQYSIRAPKQSTYSNLSPYTLPYYHTTMKAYWFDNVEVLQPHIEHHHMTNPPGRPTPTSRLRAQR